MDSCKHISLPDCSFPSHESRTINHTDRGLAFWCNSIQYICSVWAIIKECRNCYRWNIMIKSLYKRERLDRRQWTQLWSNVNNEAVGFHSWNMSDVSSSLFQTESDLVPFVSAPFVHSFFWGAWWQTQSEVSHLKYSSLFKIFFSKYVSGNNTFPSFLSSPERSADFSKWWDDSVHVISWSLLQFQF